WEINGIVVGYGSVLDHTFTSSGTYTTHLSVVDSFGLSSSYVVNITVNKSPNVSISATKTVLDAGMSDSFNASVSGGTSPYTYTWTVDDTTYTGQSIAYSFTSTGTYDIQLVVTDSFGQSAKATITITVNPDPSVTITSSQNPTDIGNSVTFTATGSGGTGSYAYQWYMNGSAISGATYSTYMTPFSHKGIPAFYAIITDSYGVKSKSNTITETVNSDPSVTIHSTKTTIDSGQSSQFFSSVSGGTGTYTYLWVLGANTLSHNTSFTHIFSTPGTYNITLTVKDANGNTASAYILVTVLQDPSGIISVKYNSIDAGAEQQFTSSISGGSGSYTYDWLSGTNTIASTSSFSRAFYSIGSHTVTLEVTDSNGFRITLTVSFNVIPQPSVS
ncbi:PKD domain-containing protein, partial [Metallibacterium scheffleri]|uniref:PKD domain-containing protein n=1 Tax=Metallibacterium scheffleri TaxID=993689 RepID=UPI0023F48A6B